MEVISGKDTSQPEEGVRHGNKFSEFLGFPTFGYEKDIIELLLELKCRQNQGKKKGGIPTSKCDRELKVRILC